MSQKVLNWYDHNGTICKLVYLSFKVKQFPYVHLYVTGYWLMLPIKKIWNVPPKLQLPGPHFEGVVWVHFHLQVDLDFKRWPFFWPYSFYRYSWGGTKKGRLIHHVLQPSFVLFFRVPFGFQARVQQHQVMFVSHWLKGQLRMVLSNIIVKCVFDKQTDSLSVCL